MPEIDKFGYDQTNFNMAFSVLPKNQNDQECVKIEEYMDFKVELKSKIAGEEG